MRAKPYVAGWTLAILQAFVLWGHLATAEARVLRDEDYLRWETAGSPDLSPDGQHLVYVRRRVEEMQDRFVSEVRIIRRDGSEERVLATDASQPKWSPDGQFIAWLASDDFGKSQLYVVHFGQPSVPIAVVHGPHRPTAAGAFEWSPDSRKLAFVGEVPLPTEFQVEMPH